MAAKPRFQLLLVKPSHYDDDGYVIRWWRAMIPSNSLAAIYGIAADCAERRVLGPDVGIDIEAIDESNTRVDVPALIARLQRNGNFGLLALVGVQSNQYPRALDIAREFRRAGVAVAIGGFHVSGCLSMLDGRAVELDACRDLGISIFAGEAEGRLEAVLQDAAAGRLAPVYNFMNDLPGMEGTVVPFLPKRYVTRTLGLSPASTPAAAVPISARSAPSSTCRGASRATVPPMMSSIWFGAIGRRASTDSSSPTTTSPATRNGKRSSID